MIRPITNFNVANSVNSYQMQKNKINFTARYFTPEQIKKCNHVIRKSSIAIGIDGSYDIFGLWKCLGVFKPKNDQIDMLKDLGEILKIGKTNTEALIKKINFSDRFPNAIPGQNEAANTSAIGRDFIEKAKELD